LALGWWLWSDGLGAALRRVPSKIVFGIWELFFSAALMLAHWIWWRHRPGRGLARTLRVLLALLAGTNLLYHFPILFAVATELIHQGDLAPTVIDAAGFRQRLLEGAVLARLLHFTLAALATCGITLMLYATWKADGGSDGAAQQRPLEVRGGRLALLAAVGQIPTGLWLMTRLPPVAQQRLLGGDTPAVALLIAGVVVALWLMHGLATIALGEPTRPLLLRSALLLAAVVVLMTGTSRRVLAPRAESGDPADVATRGDRSGANSTFTSPVDNVYQ
jgi:hypothetical protein